MRIISKFHDFYDSAQRFGHDDALMFLRAHDQWPGRGNIPKTQVPPEVFSFYTWASGCCPQSLSDHGAGVDASFGIVYFGGKLYPYACVATRQKPQVEYVYAYEELVGLLANAGVTLKNRKKYRGLYVEPERMTIEQFFELKGSTRWQPDVPSAEVAVLGFEARFHILDQHPRLADIQFFKCLSPWEAYQELSMYLGNLAAPDRVPVQVADKDRIAQHGFDKWSFRKPPA
jgi:hypothetical protein